MSKGHTGTSLGAVEYSPAWRRRQARRRQREEARWAAKAGPVTTTQAQALKPSKA